MKKGKIIFIAFIALAVVQIAVPAKLVYDNTNILFEGVEYRFRTAPVDPLDYFRGKYVALEFSEDTFDLGRPVPWQPGEPVYVVLGTDAEGFAKIIDVVEERPGDDKDFVSASVVHFPMSEINQQEDSNIVAIDYAFNRFYMEESKAQDAEWAYNEATNKRNAYAIVRVKDGEAAIEDVIVDGKPIREAAEEYGRR